MAADAGESNPEIPFPRIQEVVGGKRTPVRVQLMGWYGDVAEMKLGSGGDERRRREVLEWREMEHALVYETQIDKSYTHSRRFNVPGFNPRSDAFKKDVGVVNGTDISTIVALLAYPARAVSTVRLCPI